MSRAWKIWLHGLIGAAISSSAAALTSATVRPDVFNLGAGLSDLAWMLLVPGVVGAALYLRKSPVPPLDDAAAPTPPPAPPGAA